MHLPDCMMPDGADPCKGYSELYAENERLRAALRLARDVWVKEPGGRMNYATFQAIDEALKS